MNTKTFAQESRRILMQGVAKKLLYWGFTEKGDVLEQPEKVSGGYSFRGEVFDDPSVPNLWNSLQIAIKSKGIDVVVEEAAYTWFNRIMALRILVKNGYETPQLEDAQGLEHTPIILQKARQGKSDFLNTEEKTRLQKILTDYSKDQEAFAILIKGYCHSHKTLQRVFGKIDDYTELLLPDNMLQTDGFLHLLNTTDAISDDDYQKVELIGWLYQFYISEKKDDVFASFKKGKKAEAKDIPAATQIFTPNWIVKYMVENTAGKIWLDKHPNSKLKTSMKYLVENESDVSSSAVENSIINSIEDLTLIDPAAGSGHILVEGFDLIYKMYLEEYYTAEEAVESILKNNLFGLDIDDRAAQLATFAILLKAAKVYPAIWEKEWLPNVYAMPEDQLQNWFTTKNYDFAGDWLDLQGMKLAAPITVEWTETKKDKVKNKKITFKKGDVLNEKVVELLRDYNKLPIAVDFSKELELFWGEFEKPYHYNEFFYTMELLRQGKNLGSVIKCNISTEVINHIETRYNNWLEKEKVAGLDFEEIAILNTLKNYIPVLLLLSKKYTSVVANPPYMGRANMNSTLKYYIDQYFSNTNSDLCTVFIQVLPSLTIRNGKYGFIVPPSWMFTSSFEKLRIELINNQKIDSLIQLSRGVFGPDFGSMTTIITNTVPTELSSGTYLRLVERTFQEFNHYDLNRLFLKANNNSKFKYKFSDYSKQKPDIIHNEEGNQIYYPNIEQTNFHNIPKSPIAYWASEKIRQNFKLGILSDFSPVRKGIDTGKNNRFLRYWHEISNSKFSNLNKTKKWFIYIKGGEFRKWYGNINIVVNWENEGVEIKEFSGSTIRNKDYIKKEAITWTLLASNGFGARYVPSNCVFDNNGSSVFPIENNNFILGSLNSVVTESILKILNPTLAFQVGDIARVPMKPDYDFFEENLVSGNIDLSKKDWNSRETSWGFEQAPLLNNTNTLEEAYVTWQKDVSKDFFQLHSNEEALNRIFIDIYGLQDELTPEVALKDITILQEELAKKDLEKLEENFRANGQDAISLPINKAEVVSQFISYAIGLFMGRYRLDKKGLNIAHPNPTKEELAPYNSPFGGKGAITIDEDAILPLMGTACNFPDDALQQIYSLLDTIWGAETRTENINFIQECLNKELEKFLVKDFYKYHCKMYKKKPIYWLFASKKGAFQVLVYMHRMNAFTVEKIRANYLLEHIKNLESEIGLLESNEANLNTQEAKKLDQLRKDLQECYEYDTELKDMADKQIAFDLDDGVTVNYDKFKTVVAKIK